MLQRDPIIDELIAMLEKWVLGLEGIGITKAYLFGSAVNENGVRFEVNTSDIDIVLLVDWENLSIAERMDRLEQLKKEKEAIEVALFRKLRRQKGGEAIISLVPVTLFEFGHAIHKDGVNSILIRTPAYDLFAREMVAGLKGGGEGPSLPSEHRNTLQFVQKKRFETLSVKPNGSGGLEPLPHDDPLPKELMRHFAVATADLESSVNVSDLARGLQEINHFASEQAGWTPEMSAFQSWLGVRQGERGKIDPTIRADHYSMLVEGIFDRVRRQHPRGATAAFALTGSRPIATKTNPRTLPASHRLGAVFTVTLDDDLGGTPEAILRAIRAARANMKASVSGPFELRFEEEVDAEALIEADDETIDSAAHGRKVKAFERRTLIAARQTRWEQGVDLILRYGGTLFHGSDTAIEKACMIAIRNWFAVAATNVVNPGGMHEAWHEALYPTQPMAFSFSGGKNFGFEPRPVPTLASKILAASFVPNLVSKYLHHLETTGDAYLIVDRDTIFASRFWLYGMK